MSARFKRVMQRGVLAEKEAVRRALHAVRRRRVRHLAARLRTGSKGCRSFVCSAFRAGLCAASERQKAWPFAWRNPPARLAVQGRSTGEEKRGQKRACREKGRRCLWKRGAVHGKGQKTVWGKRSGRRARLERAAGSSLAQIAPAGAMQAERGYVCIRKKYRLCRRLRPLTNPKNKNTFRRRKTEGVSLSAPGNALSLSML